jgi:hypothetical protein
MALRNQRLVVSSFRAILVAVAGALLAASIGATQARAYPTYTGYFAGSCADCHGDFRAPFYAPPSRDDPWTDRFGQGALHGNHWDIANFNCDACHTGDQRVPVVLNSSNGSGDGAFEMGCLGCHGRAEHDAGGVVTGAGLRRHHWNAGVPCTPCHADSEPSGGFAPVGEHVLPPNYEALGIDPCNPAPDLLENYAGSLLGLDNDGDDFYDEDDLDCRRRRRCGLGFEVALLLPPLVGLRRWRNRARA